MRAAIILVLIAFAAPAAAEPCKPASGPLRMNFQLAHSVAELAVWLEKTTCKPVTVAPDVPKHSLAVTILAPREYTVKQAEKLVVTAIEAVGLSVDTRNGKLHIKRLPAFPKDCADQSK
jgi:hypothetical protein